MIFKVQQLQIIDSNQKLTFKVIGGVEKEFSLYQSSFSKYTFYL